MIKIKSSFKILILTMLTVNLFPVNSNAQNSTLSIDPEFKKIQEDFEHKWENVDINKVRGWKQFRRWEDFWLPRVGRSLEKPNVLNLYNEISKIQDKESKHNQVQAVTWVQKGPFDIPTTSSRKQGVGRINVVRLNPKNASELWIGSAGGGAWKSSNNGANWTEIKLPGTLSSSIAEIAISPSNPQVVYLATGDPNGSLTSGYDYYSTGILKSIDGGATWNLTTISYQTTETKFVTRILVHPENSDIVLAATANGIYKSIDGGKVWKQTSESNVFKDLEFCPTDPNIVYASLLSKSGVGGIYRSTNNGESFSKVHSLNNCVRTEIASAVSDPNIVYAVSAALDTRGFLSISKSLDKGATWDVVANQESVGNLLGFSFGEDVGGQGMYDLTISVNPKNASEVFVGGVNLWSSSNGANSFTQSTYWIEGYGLPSIHSDQHDLIFSPDGKSKYAANDGGIYQNTNNASTWTSLNKGLPITQFYRVGISPADPSAAIAGAQDNGTALFQSNNWTKINDADGMDCAIDPNDKTRLYASIYYGQFYYKTGSNNFRTLIDTSALRRDYSAIEGGAWVAPLLLSPFKSSTILAGYNNVWMSRSYGAKSTWKKLSDFKLSVSNTLLSLAMSPVDSNVIFAATSSNIYATFNGGTNWTSIASSANSITSIAADPVDTKKLYFTKSGFSSNDKVWLYDNGVIKNLSGDLANVPTNKIVVQNINNTIRYYVGTDMGIYVSDNLSGKWYRYGDNFPYVVVSDLEINLASKKLVAATFGRGIWEAPLLECKADKINLTFSKGLEFCDGDSLEVEVANNLSSYFWSNGSVSKKIVIKESGSFFVVSDNTNECSAKSEVFTVVVNPKPKVTISSNKGNILCDGDSIKLSAPLALQNYEWSTGEKTRNIVVKNPGTYFVSATNNAQCRTYSENFVITNGQIPTKPEITFDGEFLSSTLADKYQWIMDGVIIPGATTQKYKAKSNGKYLVMITNNDGCSSFSDEYNVTDLSSINEEIVKSSLEISPNPAHNFIQISGFKSFDQSLEISIKDLTGKEVYFEKITNNNEFIKIDISKFANASYTIEVKNSNSIEFLRFIKN